MNKKLGRPRKNKNEVRCKILGIAVTKSEKERIEKIVKIKQISINQLVRDLFIEKLKKIEKDLDIII
ncbi:hypothetical protein LCGC14_0540050 [marine sediment metagenome]|uniref:Ribbon-helix-helix protein CopG domain-containing protein n=1 Tax=marine sediment metagenome TaxID=412755 RepID=A0A0F9V174_9ZZZZ